jgi:hypothetical protein
MTPRRACCARSENARPRYIVLDVKHAGDEAFKTQIDGYNFLPFLKADVAERPRKELFYFADASFTSARLHTEAPLVTNDCIHFEQLLLLLLLPRFAHISGWYSIIYAKSDMRHLELARASMVTCVPVIRGFQWPMEA